VTEAISTLQAAESALAALGPLPFPLPLGGAAAAVAGAVSGMKKGDWLVTGPRERIGAALRGCRVARLVDPTAGARPYKLAPASALPGNRALHAVGLALVSGPTLCLLGAASAASGAFHEALNLAGSTGAPVVFVLRQPALGDAPVAPQLGASAAELARAHGIACSPVADDEDAVREAVVAARESGAPALITVG
jgi:TPP-dependent pyruvate/acetoin dehydrogenase alpha subunit